MNCLNQKFPSKQRIVTGEFFKVIEVEEKWNEQGLTLNMCPGLVSILHVLFYFILV